MAEVRTSTEALVALDRGLARWADTARAVFTQATAAADGAQSSAEAVRRRCAAKAGAAEQLLRSLGSDQDRRSAERDLAAAHAALHRADQAVRQMTSVAQRLRAVERAHAQAADTLVGAARANLANRTTELGAYRSAGPFSAGGNGAADAVTAADGSGTGGHRDWLNGTGLTEVDVSAADLGDNPVTGSFGRGGTTRADYRWAVQTWEDVVRPAVERGLTRADFEAHDTQRRAPPLRRTATVYDMFLGDCDRLRMSLRPDGKLDITNGRHRLEVARELGIRWLPAEVADV